MGKNEGNGFLMFYALLLIIGTIAWVTGRAHAAYWGPTEGTNVRIGGLLAVLWGLWGIWSSWKKKP